MLHLAIAKNRTRWLNGVRATKREPRTRPEKNEVRGSLTSPKERPLSKHYKEKRRSGAPPAGRALRSASRAPKDERGTPEPRRRQDRGEGWRETAVAVAALLAGGGRSSTRCCTYHGR
jgi:hypothetical protein